MVTQWPRYEAYFQQRAGADLLFGEPRSSSRESSVLELCPHILQLCRLEKKYRNDPKAIFFYY